MEIRLDNIGKRFTHAWIFNEVNATIPPGDHLAIIGHNGSGKSTLLKIIAGALAPSTGQVIFSKNGSIVESSRIYRKISYAAPYADLIEDFSLAEAFRFHKAFKPLAGNLSLAAFRNLLDFPFPSDLQIKYYSSGMKQRLKLGLAISSASEILILDEPGSNLDKQGKAWYQSIMHDHADSRTVIIASNEPDDIAGCTSTLNLEDYKN